MGGTLRDQTDLYDYLTIRTRIDKLRSLRANHDDHGLLFALNEGIHGNMGGMGNFTLTTQKGGERYYGL